METRPPVAGAILVSIQLPDVDDVAHTASIEELGRLVKTLGYVVVGTVSQKRDTIGGGTVLGKGRLEELAAMTGGTGVVESMAPTRKSKARERFDDADEAKPKPRPIEADPDAPKPEFVIAISPSQARNLERATGAQVLGSDRRDRRDFPSPCPQPRGQAAGRDGPPEIRVAAPAESSGGGRATGRWCRRVRSRTRSPQDPRPHRRTEGAARGHSARPRPAPLRAPRSATGCTGRLHQRRQVVIDAGAHRQRGAGRGQAVCDARYTVRALQPETRPRVLVSDTVGFIKKLPHDLVASSARRSLRRSRHRCCCSWSTRPTRHTNHTRGEPQRAARDRRGQRPFAPAAEQDRPRQRG